MMQDNRVPTESLLSAIGEFNGPAPVHLWDPPYCGKIDIRIARDGRWYHDGSLIRRPALVQLFASVLRREPDGSFSLVTPAERVSIEVEDCPFVATLLDVQGEGDARRLKFTLNTGETVTADAEHAIEVGEEGTEPHPTLHVRNGLEALISRNVFYQMVALARIESGEQGEQLVLESAGGDFLLGKI
tara:strand:+ start:415 stop:975 length:561 start_codon:yes stop_codon:yes gene_type:complete